MNLASGLHRYAMLEQAQNLFNAQPVITSNRFLAPLLSEILN